MGLIFLVSIVVLIFAALGLGVWVGKAAPCRCCGHSPADEVWAPRGTAVTPVNRARPGFPPEMPLRGPSGPAGQSKRVD